MNEEKMDALKEAIREANEPETIMIPAGGIGEVSDGYHTFNELYLHRYTLFAVLCNTYFDLQEEHFRAHSAQLRCL